MAVDVNPEIAAALAKLAEQDAAAADDAQAALEWIAGDQGLALITQESIQNFCLYQLPVKWLIEPHRQAPGRRGAGPGAGPAAAAAVRRHLPVRDDTRDPERV